MDILSQYEKQDTKPDAFKWQSPSEYSFLIRLVMNISGGRIKEVEKANYVLLGMAALIFILSLILVLRLFGVFDTPPADKIFIPLPSMGK